MGHFCDGRASLVVGTHTHVPTADHQILPGGTAYMTDAGMCGDYDSVIGMEKAEPLQPLPSASCRWSACGRPKGQATVCGVAVETDDRTGLAGPLRRSASAGACRRPRFPFGKLSRRMT